MKKFFILSAAALVALASCSKVDRENGKEISFAPNALTTKALILPDSNAPEQLAFPATETFNVFAYADLTSSGTPDYASPLMNDVEISNQEGDWKATTGIYLWPSTGTVDFYAYYPGTLAATFLSSATPAVLKFTGVNLGNTVGNQIDPLVSYTVGQIAPSKPVVQLVFKHTTSQIAALAYDATVTASLQGKISIEKVVFTNLNTKGDYTDGTTSGKGAWTNVSTPADFTIFSGSEVLSTDESYLSAGSFIASIDNSAAFVVIPSIVETGVQTIEVTYSIAPYSINGFDYPATASQTVSIPLYGKVNGNKFQNGKRYVYHIGISLDGANNEIMFSPLVEGWETEDHSGIIIDAVNAVLF